MRLAKLASRIAPGMVAALLLPSAAWLSAQEPDAEDPEDRAERLAAAGRILRDNCLSCHSMELIEGQRLTRPQWEAEVTKMVNWGSPLPPEQRPALVDHLVSGFGDAVAPYEPTRIAPAEVVAEGRQESAPVEGDPTRGRALYATHCATCHGPEGLGGDLGTNLVEKPILLRADDYLEILREGRNRMPGFRAVLTPRDDLDLLAWLRSRRGP